MSYLCGHVLGADTEEPPLIPFHCLSLYRGFVCAQSTVWSARQGHAQPRGRAYGDLEAVGGGGTRGRGPRKGEGVVRFACFAKL